MQQILNATSDPSPQQLITVRTLFSVHPTEPPSSPPPTSPLPPLPEIAPYRPSRTSSTTNSTKSGKPSRPPRPTTSLPNLKPRIIRSPEPLIHQQCITSTHRPFSPTTLERVSPICETSPPRLSTPQKRGSIRLLSPQNTPSFSDDVLAALPKLFQRSPVECRDVAVGYPPTSPTNEHGERIRAWQVYHGSTTKSPTKQKIPKSQTRKPVARSALFIPRSPEVDKSNESIEHIYTTNLPVASVSSLFPPRTTSRKQPQKLIRSQEPIAGLSHDHKQSKSTTSFTFDFGRNGYARCNPTSPSNDNLTSLPRLPSTPTLDRNLTNTQSSPKDNPQKHKVPTLVGLCHSQARSRPSEEEGAFFSIPYSNTFGHAGQRPRTDQEWTSVNIDAPSSRGSRSQPHSHQCSEGCIDLGEEGVQHVLTAEEKKRIRRKRLLWALATVLLLLIATGGILAGVVWKLKNM